METAKVFNRMVDFQQVLFDNTFSLMKTFQNHGETVMNFSIGQNSWLPEDGKKMCSYWVDTCNKGVTNYKDFMDTSLTKAREMFAPLVKSECETSEKPAKK